MFLKYWSFRSRFCFWLSLMLHLITLKEICHLIFSQYLSFVKKKRNQSCLSLFERCVFFETIKQTLCLILVRYWSAILFVHTTLPSGASLAVPNIPSPLSWGSTTKLNIRGWRRDSHPSKVCWCCPKQIAIDRVNKQLLSPILDKVQTRHRVLVDDEFFSTL